jgi:uracil-DNA glycosylase
VQTLVQARQKCRLCMEKDPELLRNGADLSFDRPVVSYWSQWLGNPKPLVLIVGQDFSNVEYFLANEGRDEAGNKTNENLRMLLARAGVATGPPPLPDHTAPVFLTNSILCLKTGSMSEPIKERWVRNCSTNHLSPLLRLLSPKIVIGMGKHGWSAVRQAFGLSSTPSSIGQAAGRSWRVNDQAICAVGHCSGLGLVNRPMQQQCKDWEQIGSFYAALRSQV